MKKNQENHWPNYFYRLSSNNEKALFSWHTGFFLLYTYIYVASLFPHTFSFFSTLISYYTIYFFTILLLQVFLIFFISKECEINTALLRTCFHHFMECWTFNFGYKICIRRKLILSLHWKNILLFSLLSQSSYKLCILLLSRVQNILEFTVAKAFNCSELQKYSDKIVTSSIHFFRYRLYSIHT